jgi:NarL family two-component system sensor histidine kinase LiaS
VLDQDIAAARSCLAEAGNLTYAAHQELNSILFELRPASAKPGDLAQALREYTDGWARQNPIRVDVKIQGDGYLDPAVQQDAFRFVQEALSNVARHSHATRVDLSLSTDQGKMVLSIQDNGCGFELDKGLTQGMGLKSMRERVTRAGGQFSLTSQPQHGTCVVAAFPLQSKSVPALVPNGQTDRSGPQLTREDDGKDA